MKAATVLVLTLLFGILLNPAFAEGPPILYFDFDKDQKADSVWHMKPGIGEKISLDIYIADWDKSSWASEPFFGAAMFFHYDDIKFQVNPENSFANDNDHGGPFDSSFTRFQDFGGGKIQLDVVEFDCTSITEYLLLYTLELESIAEGESSLYIDVDYTGGSYEGGVIPGGESCLYPRFEDAADSTVEILKSPPPGFFKRVFGKLLYFF